MALSQVNLAELAKVNPEALPSLCSAPAVSESDIGRVMPSSTVRVKELIWTIGWVLKRLES